MTNGITVRFGGNSQKNIRTVGIAPRTILYTSLAKLDDVDVTNLNNDDMLVYDETSGKFISRGLRVVDGDTTSIQIKRTLDNDPTTLQIAEQAYSYDTDRLFIGTSSGNNVVEIGGKYWVDISNDAIRTAQSAFEVANTALGGLGYDHVQSSASSVWTINHNMNHKPSVSTYTVGGSEIEGHVTHISNNTLIINFNIDIAGFARLN